MRGLLAAVLLALVCVHATQTHGDVNDKDGGHGHGVELREGSAGPDVLLLTRLLAARGEWTGAPTHVFSARVKDAVAAVQRAHGKEASGVLDGASLDTVLPTLSRDAEHATPDAVRALQEFLIETFHAAIPADEAMPGRWGDNTDMNVMELQHRSGVPVDGVVGPTTWAAFLNRAHPAVAPGLKYDADAHAPTGTSVEEAPASTVDEAYGEGESERTDAPTGTSVEEAPASTVNEAYGEGESERTVPEEETTEETTVPEEETTVPEEETTVPEEETTVPEEETTVPEEETTEETVPEEETTVPEEETTVPEETTVHAPVGEDSTSTPTVPNTNVGSNGNATTPVPDDDDGASWWAGVLDDMVMQVDDKAFHECSAGTLQLPSIRFQPCVMLLQRLLGLPTPDGIGSRATVKAVEKARRAFNAPGPATVVDKAMWEVLRVHVLEPSRRGERVIVTSAPMLGLFISRLNELGEQIQRGATRLFNLVKGFVSGDSVNEYIRERADRLAESAREIKQDVAEEEGRKREIYFGDYSDDRPTISNTNRLLKCAATDFDLLDREGWQQVVSDANALAQQLLELARARQAKCELLADELFSPDLLRWLFDPTTHGDDAEEKDEWLAEWMGDVLGALRGTPTGKQMAKNLIALANKERETFDTLETAAFAPENDVFPMTRLAVIDSLGFDVIVLQPTKDGLRVVSKLLAKTAKVTVDQLDRIEMGVATMVDQVRGTTKEIMNAVTKVERAVTSSSGMSMAREADHTYTAEHAVGKDGKPVRIRGRLGVHVLVGVIQIKTALYNALAFKLSEVQWRNVLVDGLGASATLGEVQLLVNELIEGNAEMKRGYKLLDKIGKSKILKGLGVAGKVAAPLDAAFSIWETMNLNPRKTTAIKGSLMVLSSTLKLVAATAGATGVGAIAGAALFVASAAIDIAIMFTPTECEMLRDQLGYSAGDDHDALMDVWDLYLQGGCSEFSALLDQPHGYTQVKGLVGSMTQGFWSVTVESEEEAIVRVLQCLQTEDRCNEAKRIVYELGLGRLLSKVDNDKWHDALVGVLHACEGAASDDGDVSLAWLQSQSCPSLLAAPGLDLAQHVKVVMGDWWARDEDSEKRLVEVLRCMRLGRYERYGPHLNVSQLATGCKRLRSLVKALGGPDALESALDGWEDIAMRQHFSACQVFSGYTDDASVEQIMDRWTCEDIKKATPKALGDLMANLLPSWTGEDEQDALVKVAGCLQDDCGRLREAVDAAGGAGEVWGNVGGEQEDALTELMQQCHIYAFMDDEDMAEMVNGWDCEHILGMGASGIADAITALESGWTSGDLEEGAVVRLLQCVPTEQCAVMRKVFDVVDRDDLLHSLKGAEDTALRVEFLRCDLIKSKDVSGEVARDLAAKTCPELLGIDNRLLATVLEPMMRGVTWTDWLGTSEADEAGIVKLFSCLAESDCHRLADVLIHAGGTETVLDRLDYTEFDQLLAYFMQCDVVTIDKLDDNSARMFIAELESDCKALNKFPLAVHKGLVNHLLAGATGDRDEQALVSLFRCYEHDHCALAKEVVDAVGGRSVVEGDVHGEEWDALMAVWFTCDIASLDDLDDDGARALIGHLKSDCSRLTAYPTKTLAALVQKLINGWTGDADEQALVHLFTCMQAGKCDVARAVVHEMGGRAKIESDVHGDEWDELLSLWFTCDIAQVSDLDDDAVRKLVGRLRGDCSTLTRFDADVHAALVRKLLDGWTGDEDEGAIIDLFRCMASTGQCDLAGEVVGKLGGRARIEGDMHGAEYDELLSVWYSCGMIHVNDLDDESARALVTHASCDTLKGMAARELSDLCGLMLDGATGDADEQAILDVWKCLPRRKRLEVQRTSRCSFDRLYSSFHGAEWTEMKRYIVWPDDCYAVDGKQMVKTSGSEGTDSCKDTSFWGCSSDSDCSDEWCSGDKCVCGFAYGNDCFCMKRASSDDGSPYCKTYGNNRNDL